MTRTHDLLVAIQTAPRSVLPAVLAAVAARLAEPVESPPPAPAADPEDRLLGAEDVALRLGISVAAVARRKDWPFRVKLARRTVRYRESGVESYVRNGDRP